MPKKPVKKRVSEYLTAAGLALVVLILLWAVWGIFRKEEIARRAVRDTRAELATLEARKGVLEGNIAELETERGKEATLRQAYGVAKPGEEVIIVVPADGATTTPALPWYRKVLGFFGFW